MLQSIIKQPFDSPMEKMQIARAKLLATNPFFARLAYKLDLKEDRRFETAATDGISLHFNPDHVWSLPMQEVILLWAHEVLHPALHHNTRRNGRDPDLWNDAADYVVDAVLKKAGFSLPPDYLYEPCFENMTAEQIFDILNSQKPDGKGDDQGDDNDQDNDSDDSGADQNQPQAAQNDQDEDQPDDKGDGQGQGDDGDDGQNGQPDDKKSQGGRPGDVMDYPGEPDESGQTQPYQPDQNEIKQQEQSWDTATANAAQIAKARGAMPGNLQDLVDELLEPKIDWRDVLRHFLERIAANDYSWEQPDRRFIQNGFFLPSLYNHELGDIVIAVDTSASRSIEELQQDATEMSEILGMYDTNIHLIFIDTDVQGYQKYSREDLPLQINFVGRGGTCFSPAFEWIEKHQDELNLTAMMYLTDMECWDFPKVPPDYPVLWIQNGDYHNPPPFGELVKM